MGTTTRPPHFSGCASGDGPSPGCLGQIDWEDEEGTAAVFDREEGWGVPGPLP